MSYTLGQFSSDCRTLLQKESGPEGRERVRALLERLLSDGPFVERYCVNEKPGLHVLYEDPDSGFQVLAHVNEKPRVSPPHDHGASWAIYGQATEHTDVTEFERMDDGSDPNHADLRPIKSYRLLPGRAAIYQDGMIHSIDYPEKSCFVRVTGTNLDRIPRIMIDLKTGLVKQMTPQRST
jgi:hypothetical protein